MEAEIHLVRHYAPESFDRMTGREHINPTEDDVAAAMVDGVLHVYLSDNTEGVAGEAAHAIATALTGDDGLDPGTAAAMAVSYMLDLDLIVELKA